ACIGVFDDSARRNFDDRVMCFRAVLVFAHAVRPALGFKDPFETEIHQRAQAFIDLEDDISAFPSVASGWPAVRYIFFAAECYHAIPAVATFYIYFYVIDKHIIPPSVRGSQLSSDPIRTLYQLLIAVNPNSGTTNRRDLTVPAKT